MSTSGLKIFIIYFIITLSFLCLYHNSSAQKVKYSSARVLSGKSELIQLVADCKGSHHLITFTDKSEPVINVFDKNLNYQFKTKIPFKFSEKDNVRLVLFSGYYYICIYKRTDQFYIFWKVEADGNVKDCTHSFQKLLRTLPVNYGLGFQLLTYENELRIVYKANNPDFEKNTTILVRTDSLLKLKDLITVTYDCRKDEEWVLQENFMQEKYLLVLKIALGGRALKIMKINLATGYTNTNTFYNTGFLYSHATYSYNYSDSAVTISALLTQPVELDIPKRFVFYGKLNDTLIEQQPLVLLKSQFEKDVNVNFMLADSLTKWKKFQAEWGYSNLYKQGVRFTLLNDELQIKADSVVSNNKNAYSLRGNQFFNFKAANKSYLLVQQEFGKKNRGILIIYPDDKKQLTFADVLVDGRNDYHLLKASSMQDKSVIVPYVRNREAGLIKISIE